MSIREQIEDAQFLLDSGRFKGALTMLMSAISASSRKAFPRGTARSFRQPNDFMRDEEAFTQFLGGRIHAVLFGGPLSPDFGRSGISAICRGNRHSLEYILYKFYRCELIHEGELPEDIDFSPEEGMPDPETGQLTISFTSKLVLNYAWIQILLKAVVEAKCNGAEFGIEHYEIIAKSGIDEDEVCKRFEREYGMSAGRYEYLKSVAYFFREREVSELTDEEIKSQIDELVNSGCIIKHFGAFRSIYMADASGNLTAFGLDRFREIASMYDVKKV